MPYMAEKASASMRPGRGRKVAAGGGVAVARAKSIQLKFHPDPAALVVTMRRVCCPAGRVTWAVIFWKVCHPPVLGTVTVVRALPSDLRSWNCTPLFWVATRKLMLYVPAVV